MVVAWGILSKHEILPFWAIIGANLKCILGWKLVASWVSSWTTFACHYRQEIESFVLFFVFCFVFVFVFFFQIHDNLVTSIWIKVRAFFYEFLRAWYIWFWSLRSQESNVSNGFQIGVKTKEIWLTKTTLHKRNVVLGLSLGQLLFVIWA